MKQKSIIDQITLRQDDFLFIVSHLFESDEISYHRIAKYIKKSVRDNMFDIALQFSPNNLNKKLRYVQLSVLQHEIADFIFRALK